MLTKTIRLHVILDNIRSAFNVGGIFRTSDAVGGVKLYLCGMTATPENIKMKKTALGATDSVEWEYFTNTMDAVAKVRELKIPLVAIELTEKSVHFQQYKYSNPVALVLGHEVRGVNQLVLDVCDAAVVVPMAGIKESLNVGTTAGIVMYEAVRDCV
jgi:tRNA G18 (ribose-2'-O)-methylase SpoU